MHPLLIYIIQVNIALVMFYLLYVLFFKRDTFLRIRRLFFITAIVFSLAYPMFVVDGIGKMWMSAPNTAQEVETAVFIDLSAISMVVEGEAVVADEPAQIPWKQIGIGVYVVVTLFFISRFLWQLFSILRIKWKSEKIRVSGVDVYNLKDDITPFSFFGMIFINIENHSKKEIEQIIIHEHTHVAEKHSMDIILIELILLVSWYNPFVWLMKREIAMNLEYLADKGVLKEGVDCIDYQYHLLRLTYHGTAVQIVNNFNVSQLKQRIMMMNKTRSSTLKLAKYLLVLPLFFVLIAANSVYAGDEEQDMKEPPPVKMAVTDEVFTVVEEMPQFPEGQEGMMNFLRDNTRYPVEAMKEGIQGRVICNFIIEKDGSVSEVQIVRGVDPNLDAEAVRVIESMPKWTPGKQKNEVVRTRFTMPIQFRLTGDKTPPPPPPPPVSGQLDSESGQEDIFVVVEEFPEYPGGVEAMMKFLNDSIVYPPIAKENGIQGRVVSNFVVRKDGTISDVNVVRGVDPSLDKEAVRVIESMPKWKPGRQRGQAVDVRFTLPIAFSLPKSDNSADGGRLLETKAVAEDLIPNEYDMSVVMQIVQDQVFPGGESEFMKYLNSSIKYPVLAQENGTQGLVNAVFTFSGDGAISGLRILDENGQEIAEDISDKSGKAALAREARRIITNMPKWEKGPSYVVSGKVTDSGSSPIMGASVVIKGTNTGTISDSNGSFVVNVPSRNETIAISFIGYKTQEFSLANLNTQSGTITKTIPVVFRLQNGDGSSAYSGPEPDNAVVVVGYGTK